MKVYLLHLVFRSIIKNKNEQKYTKVFKCWNERAIKLIVNLFHKKEDGSLISSNFANKV